ncbi:spr3p [Saccharomyces arboricola H-6]|uniref:Spr3p n=1 Tax=Saccharomyces arboricola (strain H-6 / AS 2.3317 / CBS 10644) TaxID=1160507 RepID=J8LNH9_SACAR|nr:spr3p [Saccharomyces arboricola H-6]
MKSKGSQLPTDCPVEFPKMISGFSEEVKVRKQVSQSQHLDYLQPTSPELKHRRQRSSSFVNGKCRNRDISSLNDNKNAEETISNSNGQDIGIRNLPRQRELLNAKNGIHFTLMVAGQSGLGKTTFVNSLFSMPLISSDIEETKPIVRYKSVIEGDGTHLRFNVIDTPGFGNSMDNAFTWRTMVNYIDEEVRSYIFQEEQPDRTKMIDNRVHCCLYFLKPSKKGIDTLDIITMKKLATRVNLIPVIAKADLLTKDELKTFKMEIREIIRVQDISVCNFFGNTVLNATQDIFQKYPFSIISSSEYVLNEKGENVKGRQYKWGTVEIENERYCDFKILQKTLFDWHLVDLVESTQEYYEKCRSEMLRTRLLKARDCLTTNCVEMTEEQRKFLQEEMNFEDIEENKLKNYKCYEIINKAVMDKVATEWDPEFITRQLDAKKRFNELSNREISKFRDWKKSLFMEQENFNQEIEDLNHQLENLQLECQDLEYKLLIGKSSNNNSTDSATLVNVRIKR